MPGMNGTGPEGQGPTTGRGAGRCAAGTGRKNAAEIGNTGQGNGRGARMDRGTKCRRQQGGRGSGRGGNR